MTRLISSRGLEAAGLLVAVVLLAVAVDRYGNALRDPRFLDGWILAGGMVLLVALELRKRILASHTAAVSLWVRVHALVGWGVIAVFAFHTDWRLPNDVFGWLLWTAFVLLAASGVAGFVLVRLVPRRLAEGGEPVAFENIGHVRTGLAREARDCAMAAVRESASSVIAASYADTLQAFFSGPRNLARHLRGSTSHRDALTGELDALAEYVDGEGKDRVAELRHFVLRKDDLDRQFALQSLLQGWSLVHVPIGYGLLLFGVVHVLMVYGFSAGAP